MSRSTPKARPNPPGINEDNAVAPPFAPRKAAHFLPMRNLDRIKRRLNFSDDSNGENVNGINATVLATGISLCQQKKLHCCHAASSKRSKKPKKSNVSIHDWNADTLPGYYMTDKQLEYLGLVKDLCYELGHVQFDSIVCHRIESDLMQNFATFANHVERFVCFDDVEGESRSSSSDHLFDGLFICSSLSNSDQAMVRPQVLDENAVDKSFSALLRTSLNEIEMKDSCSWIVRWRDFGKPSDDQVLSSDILFNRIVFHNFCPFTIYDELDNRVTFEQFSAPLRQRLTSICKDHVLKIADLCRVPYILCLDQHADKTFHGIKNVNNIKIVSNFSGGSEFSIPWT